MDASSLSYRRLVANVLAGAGGRVAAILIALVLATLLVRTLGVAAYGTWSFFFVLIGFNAQFDFGLSVAVERAVARVDEAGAARIGALLDGGLALAMGLSLGLQLLLAFVPDAWLPSLGDVASVRGCLHVLPFCLACSNAAAVAGAGLSGLQRTTTLQAQRTAMGSLAALVVILLVLAGERRPAALLLAYAAVLLAAAIVSWRAVARAVPALTLRPWHPDRAALRELTRVAGPLQAATLAAQLGDQGMRLILGSGFGAAAMGTYDLASRAAIAPRSLMASLLVALVPFAAARERSGGTAALSDSLRRSTRYAALMMGTGTIAALAVAAPLMAVWLGEAEGMSDLARQLFVLLLVSLWWQSVLSPMVALGRAVGRPLPEATVTIVSQLAGLGLALAAPSAVLAVAGMAVVLGAGALVQWLWLKRGLGVEALPSSEIRRLATIALLTGLVALGARGLSETLAWPPLVILATVSGVTLIAGGSFALALGGVSPQERAMLASMVWRPAR